MFCYRIVSVNEAIITDNNINNNTNIDTYNKVIGQHVCQQTYPVTEKGTSMKKLIATLKAKISKTLINMN